MSAKRRRGQARLGVDALPRRNAVHNVPSEESARLGARECLLAIVRRNSLIINTFATSSKPKCSHIWCVGATTCHHQKAVAQSLRKFRIPFSRRNGRPTIRGLQRKDFTLWQKKNSCLFGTETPDCSFSMCLLIWNYLLEITSFVIRGTAEHTAFAFVTASIRSLDAKSDKRLV